MKDLSHYILLAYMFRYPSNEMDTLTGKLKEIITQYDPALISKFERFMSHFKEEGLASMQEYYISTFDVQAVCSLDIGDVLFGDDYKRGLFLVNIKKEQSAAGNDCGKDLPDHLPNRLTLLPGIKDASLAGELVYSLMIPALHEMILKFGETDNLYKGMLEILVTVMEKDFPDEPYERFRFDRQGAGIHHLKCPLINGIAD